jgi:hypothetical protein
VTPVEVLLGKLPGAKKSGTGWSARCPAHDDRKPSLSISEGDDGRALVKCHAGCSADAVCAAVGLKLADLMPPSDGKATKHTNGKPRVVATYDYRDEAGELVFQVVRYQPKDFRQRKPKPGGGWDWSVKGVRAVPYRLRELLAEPSRPLGVVEGEKDADNLARLGVLATCNAGGAGNWTHRHAEFLRGRHVFVLPDNDEPGRNHARQVAESLQGIAASVRVVELPGLPPKGDASDWIAAGGTKDELKRLIEATPEWTPPQEWPEIQPFDSQDLPEFPAHVLPGVLRTWVEAESHATQTPADLAGLLALAVCSATIARRVVVQPRPGWREPVNLFVAVLLEPGNRKSAVFADATRPLRDLEAELVEAARPFVARAQSERRQSEARLRKLEKQAGEKDDPDARHRAGELAAELAELPEPVLPRLLVDDATSEKLGILLDEQGGRVASMSPEGGVFDLMAGLYSKSGVPQFGVYLMGHSGDDLVTDRVSRKSVHVKRPALTCAYAIQPAVIAGLAENVAFRGRGLLARFLYAAPRSWIGRRKIAPAPVPDAVRDAYHRAVRRLASLEGEFVLGLSPEASAALQAWEAEVEGMLGDGGPMEVMRDWGAKLVGATLRLAAVLHCVGHGPEVPVGGPTLAAAVAIARYLVPHAEAVLHMMEAKDESCDGDAHYVLRWVERHGKRDFTRSEAQHHGKRRFPKADDIDPALTELVSRGYVRLRPAQATGPGRPPSPTYEVNPAVFEGGKRSRNSRNPAGADDRDDSGNIGSAFEDATPEALAPSAAHETSTTDMAPGYSVGVDRLVAVETRPDDASDFPFGLNTHDDPAGGRLFPEPPRGLPD